MARGKQFTPQENFVIYEAIDHLLLQADISSDEFYRDGFIQRLKDWKAAPCLQWINDFQKHYDPYSLEMIEECYKEACCDLIEYFSQD